MASRQAWGILSLASCNARVRRLFSRARHSASTSSPKSSSKASAVRSAWLCCSFQAAAMVPSLRACSLSSEGAFSMSAGPLPSLVVHRPTPVFRGGHALAAMEDLDGGRGAARVDVLVQERMRDGVVVPVDVDVVVDVDPRVDRPVADDEGLGREGMERGLIKLGEELASTGSIDAHDLRVERLQEVADADVEGGEREEALVAEAGEDPALDDLNSDLHLRFIARTPRAGGDDDGGVVLRELLVGALEARLVPTGHGDAALELIAHDDRGDAAQEGEGALMAGDPV